MAHTLKDTIDLAVKTAILRAHPIGSYYLTEGNEDPKDFIGGGANPSRLCPHGGVCMHGSALPRVGVR